MKAGLESRLREQVLNTSKDCTQQELYWLECMDGMDLLMSIYMIIIIAS